MSEDKLPCGALIRQPFGYVLRRFPGKTHYPCVNYELPFERQLKRVTDVADNERALRHVAQSREFCRGFAACYVISADGVDKAKIGLTTNPRGRLKAISTAFPQKPKIYALFWSFDHPAGQLEHMVLTKAKNDGIRANGEWINLSGEAASRYALKAIWGQGIFVDSREFFEQWLRRPVTERPEKYWTEERMQAEHGKVLKPVRGFLHL